jgi:Fur family peroxide stress response transcriptional regulator
LSAPEPPDPPPNTDYHGTIPVRNDSCLGNTVSAEIILDDTAGPPMHRRQHDLNEFFRRNGLRRTKQRELIYSALSASRAHPTAEELFRVVRADEPGLSLATVYNTLDTFVARGLARKIPSQAGNGPSRYDADTEPHAHVLLEDGSIVDVPDELARRIGGDLDADLAALIADRLGIEITGVQVQFTGRRRGTDAERS